VTNNAVASASTSMQIASSAGQNKLVNGTISIQFLKDPTDPKWKNDAAMKLYRKIMKQYAPSANAADPLHVYGMAAAWTAAGSNLWNTGRRSSPRHQGPSSAGSSTRSRPARFAWRS